MSAGSSDERILTPAALAVEVLFVHHLRHAVAEPLTPELRSSLETVLANQSAEGLQASGEIALYAAHLITIDAGWVLASLVPHFGWERSAVMARAMWRGYLRMPRVNEALVGALSAEILATAAHYDELGDAGPSYVSLLVYLACARLPMFKSEGLRSAFYLLPVGGLQAAARALEHELESAGAHAGSFWRNRGERFFRGIWPQRNQQITAALTEPLARMVLAAGDAFPEALTVTKPWLVHTERADSIVYELHASGICQVAPESALDLLHSVIAPMRRPPYKLDACLQQIAAALPSAHLDVRYIALRRLTQP